MTQGDRLSILTKYLVKDEISDTSILTTVDYVYGTPYRFLSVTRDKSV